MSSTPPLPQPTDNPTLPSEDPSTSIPLKSVSSKEPATDDDTAPSETPV